MDYSARLATLHQVSRELDTHFERLRHQEALLAQSLAQLSEVHGSLRSAKSELAQVMERVHRTQQLLPTLARAEAITRVQQRIDTTPFELFARTIPVSAARSKGTQ